LYVEKRKGDNSETGGERRVCSGDAGNICVSTARSRSEN